MILVCQGMMLRKFWKALPFNIPFSCRKNRKHSVCDKKHCNSYMQSAWLWKRYFRRTFWHFLIVCKVHSVLAVCLEQTLQGELWDIAWENRKNIHWYIWLWISFSSLYTWKHIIFLHLFYKHLHLGTLNFAGAYSQFKKLDVSHVVFF